MISFGGEVITKKKITSTTEEISAKRFPTGTYYFRAENEKEFITKTFVVQ